MTNLIQEFYDKEWQKVGQMKEIGPMSRHHRRLIRKLIKGLDFKTVLDVGCGEGSPLYELFSNQNDISYSGLDISEVAINFARQKNPSVRFFAIDITREFLSERFDLIICSEVLEHIQKDREALENISKMVKQYLVVTTIQGTMQSYEKDIGHVRNYQKAELLTKIEQVGFRVLKVIEWGFPFYSPFYRSILGTLGSSHRQVTQGEFGFVRKLLSQFLYYLFLLNSTKKGDQLAILAER